MKRIALVADGIGHVGDHADRNLAGRREGNKRGLLHFHRQNAVAGVSREFTRGFPVGLWFANIASASKELTSP